MADAADDQPLPGAEVTVRLREDNAPINTGRDPLPISRELANADGLVRLGGLSSGATYYAVGRFPGYSLSYEIDSCTGSGSNEFVLRLHEFQDVSLVQLIANPAHWDGKYVQVVGFLRLEFEGTALYLHKEDWRKSLLKNAIWVDADFDL